MYKASDLESTPYVIHRGWNSQAFESYPVLTVEELAYELRNQMKNSGKNIGCQVSFRLQEFHDEPIEDWFISHFNSEGVLTDAALTLYDGNEEFVAILLNLEGHQWDLNSDYEFVYSGGKLKHGEATSIKEVFENSL